jgi:hypothetical protein
MNVDKLLELVERFNWYVTPINPSTKKPFFKWGQPENRSNDPKVIREWYDKLHCVFAVLAGYSGVSILDVDKKFIDGDEKVKGFETVPDTFTVRSPGGGYHFYFQEVPGCPTVAGEVAKGIDLRGGCYNGRNGGYALAPYSVNSKGGEYTVVKDIEPCIAPDWLLQWITDYHKPDIGKAIPKESIDYTATILKATEWVRLRDKPVSNEGKMHHALYVTCVKLAKDFSLPEAIGRFLVEQWNRRAEPYLDAAEVQQQYTSAMNAKSVSEGCWAVSKELPTFSDRVWDTVTPEAVTWLWQGKIPIGKLTIIAGDPGSGKTRVVSDVIARVTKGMEMPDSSPGVGPWNVLVMNAEDGLADTLVPCLTAMNADLSRIRSITKPGFNLVDDLDYMFHYISQNDIKLVVLDPIVNYLKGAKDNQGTELRSILTPITERFNQMGVTLITPHHYNKGDITTKVLYRVCGSISYSGVSRAVCAVCNDRYDEDKRLLLCAKFNLGPMPKGLAYRIGGNGLVLWDSTFDGHITPDEAMDGSLVKASCLEKAKKFLREFINTGTMYSNEVYLAAEGEGISKVTLLRAARILKVKINKLADGRSLWSLL